MNSWVIALTACIAVLVCTIVVWTLVGGKKSSVTYVVYDGARPENYPVDAVYTWVNPADDAWKQAYSAHFPDATLSKKRFNNSRTPHAELQTSVELLLMHCPWLRTVYIATMRPQVPPFLHEPKFVPLVQQGKVKVVHHDEFFDSPSSLPVFNSHAIEANLHRIPNLAKQWLYLNDDFMTGKPVDKNMLFCDGKPVLRGQFVPVNHFGLRLEEHVSCWVNSGKLLDLGMYFHNDHNTAAHDRDVVARTARAADLAHTWTRTARARLRDHDQIVPLGLVDNVALHAGDYVCFKHNPIRTKMILAKFMRWRRDMSRLKKYHFFCINNIPDDHMLQHMNSIRDAFGLSRMAD